MTGCIDFRWSLPPILQDSNTVTSKKACILRKDSSLKGYGTLIRKFVNYQMMLKTDMIYISTILFKLIIFAPGTV